MKKYIILLTVLISFLSLQGQSHHDKLRNAIKINQTDCQIDSDFKHSNCRFKDIDTVYYTHFNESPVDYFYEVKETIDSTVIETFKLANKVAIERKSKPDLVLIYEYLDGIGGTLAKAYYPPCDDRIVQKLIFDNYDMPPGKSTPDSLMILYNDVKDIRTITKHELGHILGFKHNGETSSLMYPYYDGPKGWSKNDSLGFLLTYSLNPFVRIEKNNSYKLTDNFNSIEFFSKCKGLDYHLIHTNLVIAIQQIRSFYSSAIYITSSYRHKTCNTKAGGSNRSQHLAGRALDFKFKDKNVLDRFVDDINNKKAIYYLLKNTGINGIGLYNSHIHIDTRKGKFTIWDYTNNFSTNEECGL